MSYGNLNTQAKPDVTAFERIIRLAAVRERSSQEMYKRLGGEGFDSSDIEAAITRAIDYGYIDDRRFATALYNSRYSAGYGIPGIFRELAEYGLSEEDVEAASECFDRGDSESEIQRAVNLLQRKNVRGSHARDKSYRTLIRKGYSSSVSSTASRIWCDIIAGRECSDSIESFI